MAGLGEICNVASDMAYNLVKKMHDVENYDELYASVRVEAYVSYDGYGSFEMIGSGVSRGKYKDVYILAKEAFDQAARYKRQLSYYSDSYYKVIVMVGRFSDETIVR